MRARENIANSYKKFADTRTSHAPTLRPTHTHTFMHTHTHAHRLNTQAPACKSQRGFFIISLYFTCLRMSARVCVCARVCVPVGIHVHASMCVCVYVCGDGDGGKAFGSHSLISMWPLPGGESSLLARCVRCLCVCAACVCGCVCVCYACVCFMFTCV